MDVYHRLTGDEGDFFIPIDLELSLQELSYICRYREERRKRVEEDRKERKYGKERKNEKKTGRWMEKKERKKDAWIGKIDR